MTPEKLLLALEAGLTEPFNRLALKLEVMAEEDDAILQLANSPTKSLAVFICEECTVADTPDTQDAGLGDLHLTLIIHHTKGLTAQHGSGMWKESGNGRLPLLALCTAARGLVQRCRFPDRDDIDQAHTSFRFLGQKPFRPQGTRGFSALELSFRLTAAFDWPEGKPINLTLPV